MMQLKHHDQRQTIEQSHDACSQSKPIMKSQCLIYIVKENSHPGSPYLQTTRVGDRLDGDNNIRS